MLRGDPGIGTVPFDAELESAFLQSADLHGVQALLCAQLRSSDCWRGWPSDLRRALAAEAASQTALEMLQAQETVTVLEALTQSGVRPLLMKGAPLAYTHYRSPHLRPRGDTDALIPRVERETAGSVLAGLGYARRNLTSGELVSYQYTWSRLDRHGMTHAIDLHWRVSNNQMFAEALSYDELARGSVAVPQLGGRALGPVHALLLACMHRVVHITAPYFADDSIHYGDRLIWLYDIHLLVSQMPPHELT
ncbi:MAG: nucleotidyltransferase family protein, partial [Acidobacteria bacterium]|nr:nucleotidyltransferase family protein [Acidobacteriota bacterium]